MVAIIARGNGNSSSAMRDTCGLLKNYWYAAVQSRQLRRRPLGRTVLGEMIVVWRDDNGHAVAMANRCLHRNAMLSEGDLFDGCIGCPYHGWTYDRDGRCVNIPSEGPNGGVPSGLTLETFPVIERYGLIWVWMGGDHAPDCEPFEMPYWDNSAWGTYYMETSFSNSVTNLVENFMDVPHTVFVHKGWFRNRRRQSVKMTVERTDSSVLVTYDQPNDSIGFSQRLVNPRGLPMTHTDRFYMPNVTRVNYTFGEGDSGFVITSTCTPISATETNVFTLISYKLGPLNVLARYLLPPYTRQVIKQDVGIMANQGTALRHARPEFVSTPADTLHVFIESLRDHAASGGHGPRPAPTVETVEFWI